MTNKKPTGVDCSSVSVGDKPRGRMWACSFKPGIGLTDDPLPIRAVILPGTFTHFPSWIISQGETEMMIFTEREL